MAVNVTQKDKTLTEVMLHCSESAHVWASMPGDFSSGYHKAMTDVVAYCRERLGYTGSMPLEVSNQSEREHFMSTRINCIEVGEDWCDIPVYKCSCGYSTRDGYEAISHINVQAQLKKGMN